MTRTYLRGFPGENRQISLPHGFTGDGSQIAVIGTHGANGWTHQWFSPAGSQTAQVGPFNVMQEILRRDIPFCAIDAGGPSTFGNPASLTALTNAVDYMASLGCRADKVILAGVSMGNLVNMNWARANKAKVAAILGLIPASNTTAAHAANRGGYTAAIDAAFPPGWSEATHGALYNPATYKAELAGIPTRLYYSSNDTQVLPQEVIDLAAGIGPSAEAISIGASGHSSDLINAASAVDWLQQYAN